MSQTAEPPPVERTDEPHGFYGVEQARSTEEIPSTIWAEIDEFVAGHPGGRERLIPLLHMVQGRLGYLPFPVQEDIADKLGLSPIQVYGVVSFYHFFTTVPRGKHELKICMGTACFVRHALRLIETAKQVLDIEVGEVGEDRLFGLEQVRCLGACGLAPAAMHNGETIGELTPKALRKMLIRLKSQERRLKSLNSREASGE
jgi:NADH:ubiquinone oxidoreductase subunit E